MGFPLRLIKLELLNMKCFSVLLFSIFFVLYSSNVHSIEESSCDALGFWTYPQFNQKANLKDRSLYEASTKDRVAFWEKCANEVHWFEKWTEPFSWDMPYAKWYINGKLNIAYNCLDKHLDTDGDKIALIWCNEAGEERKITYREIYEDVCRLANGLKKLGVKKGDVVALYMPMTPEGIASMLACARIGAVHSVIFGGTGAGSTKEKINDAKAKVVITADVTYRRGRPIPLADTISKILDECPTVENVVLLERLGAKESLPSKYVSYGKLVGNSSIECPPEAMDSEDMLFVLYTSGTTGKPKGIIHTTGGYLVGVHNTFKWVFDYKPDDIFWCTADIGWITGHSYVVYGPMSNGVTQLIYEGTFDYPNKSQAWDLVDKYKVNIFYTAPTLIRTFMRWGTDKLANKDLSSLRLLGSIGEPLNPEAWEWFHSYVGNQKCPIVDTWFQTETGALAIAPIPGITRLKPGSITTPLPGFEAEILDEAGKKVEHGFLAITSPFPSMLRGVLNDPERYYNTYWAKWNGKFYYAGDDAIKDDDGYFWVGGRADEVIKVSGHRIGTAELENAMIDYSSVSESAAIAIPDEIKGNKIIALVVLKEGVSESELLKERIRQHVGEYIGKYAQPELVAFVKDLPKTRSGKILRRVLANLIQGKETGDLTTLQNPEIITHLENVCSEIKNLIVDVKS
jgi:acetyl-CoA synthetase